MFPARVNLNLLHSLYHLLNTASVNKAADQMFISHSAMSKNLAQLREALNDPILIRNGNQNILSSRAIQLKEDVATVLGLANQIFTKEEFNPGLCDRKFTIAMNDQLCQRLIPGLVNSLMRNAPNIKLKLVNIERDVGQDMIEGKVDISLQFTSSDCDQVTGERYIEAPLVLAMNESHPLAKSKLNAERLSAYPMISRTTENAGTRRIKAQFEDAGINITPHIETTFMSVVHAILAENREIISIVPRPFAEHASEHYPIIYRDLPFNIEALTFFILWPKFQTHDPAHSWLREKIMEGIKKMAADKA